MDKLRKTSNIPPTTLSASISDSDTTIPLSSTVGAETSTYIDIVIDRIDAAGEKTPDKMEVVTVLISGNNGTNAIRGRTAPAMPHEQGAVVEYNISTSVLHNDLIDGVSSILTSEGKPKEKAIPLSSVNGGTKGGVLIVDNDGDVTVGKTTADNIDFTTMPYMAKTTAGTDGQVIGGNTLVTAAFRRVIASKGDIEATTNGVKIKKPGWYSVVGAASFGDAPNSNTFIRVAVKSESESGEVRLITPLERLVVGEIWRGLSINMNLKLEVGDIVLLEVQNAHSANTRLSSMNEERRIYQYSLSVTMLNSD